MLVNWLDIIFKFLRLTIVEIRSLKYYFVYLIVITIVYTVYTSISKNMLFSDKVTVWEPGDQKDEQAGKERFEHK